MDKITRILWLYSTLARGTPVNKELFCAETQALPRSFDRDIEDVRLFLSESYDHRQLVYDRKSKHYTMGSTMSEPLEKAELILLIQLLTESRLLNRDEYMPFIRNLVQHGTKDAELSSVVSELSSDYKEPLHRTALLKMYSDLNHVIYSKNIIRIRYIDASDIINEYLVLPCQVRLEFGQLSLTAFSYGSDYRVPNVYLLELIQSFSIEGIQTLEERTSVTRFLTQRS